MNQKLFTPTNGLSGMQNSVQSYFSRTDNITKDGFVILKCQHPKFVEIEWIYKEVAFSEQENQDGTISLKFSYDVLSGKVSDSDKKEFETLLGDILVYELEHQLEKGEAIYHGGVD